MISEPIVVNGNKTHVPLYSELEEAVRKLKDRFVLKSAGSPMSLQEVDCILRDLTSCLLGRHILLAGGSNGMWTDYMISPQEYFAGKSLVELDLSMVERFFLFHSPAVLAQRELCAMLKKTAQSHVGEGKTFASVPCGLMRDLLSLDYSGVKDIALVGIDIDQDSIDKSKALATEKGIDYVTYFQEDAWNLQHENTFDFISSIGLNMYENDNDKVVDLYKNLYKALKPGGVLFTGILTYPPYIDADKSDWDLTSIPAFDMRLEEGIHRDILDIQWFNFRTLAEAVDDFKKAGFTDVRIEKDSRSIFPAIIAIK